MKYKSKSVKNYEQYIIYENGMIENTKTKKILKYRQVDKKSTVMLYNHNRRQTFMITRLIYETWYDVELTPDDIIKFKDNNCNNFHYTNLININDKNKHLNHMNLDSTKEWKISKDFDNYKISNYGDVFSIKSNKILKPYLALDGYYRASLSKNKKNHILFKDNALPAMLNFLLQGCREVLQNNYIIK